MNKEVVARMIRNMKEHPLTYNQGAHYRESNSDNPCGASACLAGEAVIATKEVFEEGLKLAFELSRNDINERAGEVLGLPEYSVDKARVFGSEASGWPMPHALNFQSASGNKDLERLAAIGYLEEALQRGTMLWETKRRKNDNLSQT